MSEVTADPKCDDEDCPRVGRSCQYPHDGCPANGAAETEGCPPPLRCTDRPELCPAPCSPVARNAGTNWNDESWRP